MSEEALYEVLFDIATSLRTLVNNTGRIAYVLEHPITIRVKDPDEEEYYEEEEEQINNKQEAIIISDDSEKE